MSKIIYILSNSKKLLYTIDTEEFFSADKFFKKIKLLNPELELNEVFTMNDKKLLYPVYRQEENEFIIYHGNSNSNKNYKEEKEKISHLKIINNNTGVIEFFLPVPSYSKHHINGVIESFLRDNKDYEIVYCKTTGYKQLQKSYNPNPNPNYNQFLTLGYGIGLIVNSLQEGYLEPSCLQLPPPQLPPQLPPPLPPPALPPPRSLPLSSRPPLPRSQPLPPRLQPQTNYFSNNRESPEISTESLLTLNLLNGVNEFNASSDSFQNNTPQLKSDNLNLQSNSKLRSYSETFLSEFFNSQNNNSPPPSSPYESCESPHPFEPPPPYVPRAEFS